MPVSNGQWALINGQWKRRPPTAGVRTSRTARSRRTSAGFTLTMLRGSIHKSRSVFDLCVLQGWVQLVSTHHGLEGTLTPSPRADVCTDLSSLQTVTAIYFKLGSIKGIRSH